MLKSWTITRATGTGIVAGLLSVLLWPVYAAWQEGVRLLYVATLGLTAVCGASILAITAGDLLLHRRRGSKVIPIRAFDIVVGALLAAPSLIALGTILPDMMLI